MATILDFRFLQPHPSAPPDAVGSVQCSPIWESIGNWALDFYVTEPVNALQSLEPSAPLRADGLWQTTCFEVFLQRDGDEGYFEFNFSPSGKWAAYRFEGYRRGMTDFEMPTPTITGPNKDQVRMALRARYERWGMAQDVIDVLLAADMPVGDPSTAPFGLRAMIDDVALPTEGRWRAGICAVIEEATGTKSYWALHHPSDKPDFHHPDSFVLELP